MSLTNQLYKALLNKFNLNEVVCHRVSLKQEATIIPRHALMIEIFHPSLKSVLF